MIGTPAKSPNCHHEQIYALPLLTIKMDKGTGVVTSVPRCVCIEFVGEC